MRMVVIKIKKSNILVGLFFAWMMIDMYSVTTLPAKELAITSVMLTYFAGLLILGYSLNGKNLFDKEILPLNISVGLFLCLYVLLYAVRGIYDNDYPLMLVLLNLLFFLAVVNFNLESSHMDVMAMVGALVSLLLIVQWLINGMPLSNFQGDIRNPNIMGVFSSCLLFFNIIGMRKIGGFKRYIFVIAIVMNLLIIYVSSARAVLLLIATVIGSMIILTVSRKLFSFLFYIIMIFSASFLVFYGKFATSPKFEFLNGLSQQGFGKNFFSGRQSIWGPALGYGMQKPLLGHMVGVTPSEYIHWKFFKHAHNQFLQIFLESGIAGIILFSLILLFIWKSYQKGLDDVVVRWSACFFLGIIVYQTVEISLLGNIEPISLLHWLIIGVGVSFVHNRKCLQLYSDIAEVNTIDGC